MTHVRHRGADRPDRRPDARRLARGQLQLALDLLHQPARRPAGAGGLLLPGRRPRLPEGGAGGAATAAAELRLHRPGPAGAGDVLLGSPAQQGAGVGLVRRSVLADADADGPVRGRRWAVCLSASCGSSNPLVNFRVLGERNLAVSCVIMFCAFAVLYAASIALPAMLQALFGYDAFHSGLVLSPAGISSIACW